MKEFHMYVKDHIDHLAYNIIVWHEEQNCCWGFQEKKGDEVLSADLHLVFRALLFKMTII